MWSAGSHRLHKESEKSDHALIDNRMKLDTVLTVDEVVI